MSSTEWGGAVSTFGEKLNVRSDDSGFVQSSGDKFQIVDSGEFRVEAWNAQNELVDWIYFYSVQPSDIALRSGTAHHFKWSASTENSFAMLAFHFVVTQPRTLV